MAGNLALNEDTDNLVWNDDTLVTVIAIMTAAEVKDIMVDEVLT